ncbi:MAG: hypothetical protein ACI8ZM_002704 [Crocinitomix sp.]
MRTNIGKYLCFGFLVLLTKGVFAQALIYSDLDLNDGGYINHIYNDSYSDSYIVVGNFTEIGGVARKNLAFIDRNDFSVRSIDLISDIDGEIEKIVVHQYIFAGYRMSLYIGGDFETVNGSTHKGIAKFSYVSPSPPAPDDAPFYTLHSWEPQLVYGSGSTWAENGIVKDLEIVSDTLFIGGNFVAVDNNALLSDQRPLGAAAFNILSNADYNVLNASANSCLTNDIDYFQGQIYLSGINDEPGFGKFALGRYNLDGTFDTDFGKRGFNLVGEAGLPYGEGYQNFALGDSSFIHYWTSTDGESASVIIYRHEEMIFDPTSLYLSANTSNCISGATAYKNVVYVARDKSAYIFEAPSVLGMHIQETEPPPFDIEWNGFIETVFDQTKRENVFAANNVLFISNDELSAAETGGGEPGIPRTGLAVYCLEPANIDDFTVFDTTICQRDTLTYTAEQVEFADGYIWEFTGTGIDIGVTGAFENLSDTLFNIDVDAWTRQIRFTPEFTPGELNVTPFTTCNNNIEDGVLIPSNTTSITINTNPLPNAFAGNDTTLTCDFTEVVLLGHSDSADVIFEWNKLGGDPLLDVHPYQDTLVDSAHTYILTVINDLGCLNYDTVLVEMDTIRPNFDVIMGPFDLTCSDTVRTYLGFCNNLADTTSFWRQLSTGDTLANPIDVTLPGQYQFYTVNNENGCIDSLNMAVLVYLNQPSPNIVITGYDDIPVIEPLDTLDCYTPSLTLECYSDTASTILNWVEADSTDPLGAIIDITAGGNYYILAQNTLNGCFNYVGLNIAEDFTKPNVILPAITALNCSNDSLVLNGSTIFADTIMEWTGDGISPSENPVTIFDHGTYYLTITKNDNGCAEVDSLAVISDSSIDVYAGNDTIVCDESLVFLNVIYGGTISGIIYLWDNGTTDPAAVYTAGTDEYAMVEIFGDDDCYGFDTVYIAIPPVPVIEFEAFQPCRGGPTGSIIASPISGLAPFEYSIDGGANFQESPAIIGLDFGNYTITVKDSLDCLYEYSAVIDETSDLPTPLFIFSTYNFQMDTVIVVDVSNPPTDSVNWIFSEALAYVGDFDGSPLVALPDTGSFIITMDAYYGDCLVSISKEIFVSEFDSTFATFTNQNGIKSIDLYPNPTNGTFTAEIEFYKKQRVAMGVQDMLGYVYEERQFAEVAELVEVFELGPEAVNGTYVLRIISEFDSAYLTFILSR